MPRFDPAAHHHAARSAPRSVRGFLTTARGATRLVRGAAPGLTRAGQAGHLLQVVLLAAQVLLSKLTLEAILDASRNDGSVADALPALVGLVAAGTLSSVVATLLVQLQRMLAELVRRATLRAMVDVTTSVDLVRFEAPEFFDDLQRVQATALTRPLTMVQGLTQSFGGVLSVAALVVVLALIEPLLVPALLVAAVPLLVLSRVSGREEFRFTVVQTTGQRVRNYLLRVLTGREEAAELRAYELAAPLRGRWEESLGRYLADLRGHLVRQGLLALGGAAVTVVVTSASLALLVALVLDGRITLADAGAAVLAIRLLGSRVQQVSSGISQVLQSALFLEDFDRFVGQARAPAEVAADGAPELAEVELDAARFRYPGATRDAVAGVSVALRAGEVVAVVGENGSGKTTLAKLVAGLHAPTGGAVAFRDADGRPLASGAVRRSVALVLQDFVRFQLTARENIAFGRVAPPPGDAAVRTAAERAGALDVLEGLPGGLDALLGREFPGGHDLSGGQWQRVALARAFLRDAPFLVLDEPSSALDARAEHALFDRVRELARGRAVLLISHRFSTVTSADRILVMSEGRVVEEGSHPELLAAGGIYAELFGLQAGSYR